MTDPIEMMRVFARKLRAKAEWDYCDHYYFQQGEPRVQVHPARELASDIADLIDEAFNFDTNITRQDHLRRHNIHTLGQFKP